MAHFVFTLYYHNSGESRNPVIFAWEPALTFPPAAISGSRVRHGNTVTKPERNSEDKQMGDFYHPARAESHGSSAISIFWLTAPGEAVYIIVISLKNRPLCYNVPEEKGRKQL